MKKIKKVLIIVNLRKENAQSLLDEMEAYFYKIGVEASVFSFVNKPINLPDFTEVDLIFSLGGDGTVLFSARASKDLNIPIIPVNIGDIGFITEISRNEWRSVFLELREGNLGYSERIMLSGYILRDKRKISLETALNEYVITSKEISKVIKLKLFLDDNKVGRYRADGIIIAAPTGSTGYNASAGGPIVDPQMSAFIVNPICPYTLSNRQFILPGESTLTVHVEDNQRSELCITADGQVTYNLFEGDKIVIKKYKHKAKIVRSIKRNFYQVLRDKLNWSGGPDA